MENKDLNRLKVVLAEKKRTNKWLAEQLGKDPATICLIREKVVTFRMVKLNMLLSIFLITK